MKKWNCLIIEDEPLAAEILVDHIQEVEHLHLVGICKDALKATSMLATQKVDLIFLDLHLPRIKGFDFLKSLSHPPKVIVTTAYHQYALEGYEHSIVDYLLKPIELPQFLAAIQKLQRFYPAAPPPAEKWEREFMFFNVKKRKVKVFLEEINYIESWRDYIKIHLPSEIIVSKYLIGQLATQLPAQQFLRVHRSFIINTEKIKTYGNTSVEIGEQLIPVGRNYRQVFQEFCQRL